MEVFVPDSECLLLGIDNRLCHDFPIAIGLFYPARLNSLASKRLSVMAGTGKLKSKPLLHIANC